MKILFSRNILQMLREGLQVRETAHTHTHNVPGEMINGNHRVWSLNLHQG